MTDTKRLEWLIAEGYIAELLHRLGVLGYNSEREGLDSVVASEPPDPGRVLPTDAERLDWFDTNRPCIHHLHSLGFHFSVSYKGSSDTYEGRTIREAIDAAMSPLGVDTQRAVEE